MSSKVISSSNSVRPRTEATSNMQKPSLTKDELIEALTYRLSREEELEQENLVLKRKLNSVTATDEHISRAKQLLVEKENELQKLRERNATMAERKFTVDQSRTENTLSTNRQSDLEREYRDDFRDGVRVDAIDTIAAKLGQHKQKERNSSSDQLKAYRLACLIFEVIFFLNPSFLLSERIHHVCAVTGDHKKKSYECSSKAREHFINFYSSMLMTLVAEAPNLGLSEDKYKKLSESSKKSSKKSSNPMPFSQESLNEVMVLVKEEAVRHNLEALVKDVKREVKKTWRKNDKKLLPNFEKSLKTNLKGYIEYCTRFAWRIVTQVPPLKIDYKSSTFNSSYHTESQAFLFSAQQSTSRRWVDSQTPKQIKCWVWPTLCDSENRVIEKGDVVLET